MPTKPIKITRQIIELERDWNHTTRRASWSTGGTTYTGRCCHMMALKAARALATVRTIHAR